MHTKPALKKFKKQVLEDSLVTPCTLSEAMVRLGFVQADPIRRPARAQDLILRHRVQNYRAGDLERAYPKLDLEECYLYAYGFASPDLWQAIHPRKTEPLTDAERQALELVRHHGPMRPKDLEALTKEERKKNYWGGFSRTAKLTLESLHGRGELRIAHREKGMRIYDVATPFEQTLSNDTRFKIILLKSLQAMGATTSTFLLKELAHFKNLTPTRKERQACLKALINDGQVRIDLVDNVEYLSLAEEYRDSRSITGMRILAPFDPIVRDRARFEHLWGWSYRFEAYVPKAKRKMGYYAMPVLWRDDVIGWANASVTNDRLLVEFGYAKKRPDSKTFRAAAEKEVARLGKFLKIKNANWDIRL